MCDGMDPFLQSAVNPVFQQKLVVFEEVSQPLEKCLEVSRSLIHA